MSNTIDTNLCIKITRGNIHDNDGNTCENDGNIRGKSCQLKLNNMNCHTNCHVGFSAQIGVPSIIVNL